MIEEIRIHQKIIALIFIGLITIAMFVIFIYSYTHRGTSRPTNNEMMTLSLHAREILNESRNVHNVLSKVTRADQSNFLLVDGADVTFQNIDIQKEGASSDNLKTRQTGLNSAVVTGYKAHLAMYTSDVQINAVGSNAFYTSGTDAKTEVYDTNINLNEPYSSALVASHYGEIVGNNITAYSKSVKSPSIDTVTPNSKVKVSNSLFETKAALSPIIYASGSVELETSTGNTNNSPIAILENTGNVFVHESTFMAAAGGVPDGFQETGILIYGDNKVVDPQKFTSIKSSLNIDRNYPFYNTASMFYIQNTNADINLTGSPLNFGSGVLAYVYNSNVNLYASGEQLTGNILMDNNSTFNITMKYASSYDIALSNENINITIDSNSTLNLLGDTYIGELNNEDTTNSNINFNSYHLYVKGVPIN